MKCVKFRGVFCFNLIKRHHSAYNINYRRIRIGKEEITLQEQIRPIGPAQQNIQEATSMKIKNITKNNINSNPRRGRPLRGIRGAVCLCLTIVLVCSMAAEALAWGNGADERTSWQKSIALDEPDFSSAEAFTVNVKPIPGKGQGLGIGTHDLMLEQAVAQAICYGADPSWIDVNVAQKATRDPDYIAAVRARFLYGGDYRGQNIGGTGPRDIGILYYEIADALKKGDRTTASQKLGWMAHYLNDITQPFHNANWTQMKPIPQSRQHNMHLAYEVDVDHYIRQTVGYPRNKWKDDLSIAMKYIPALQQVTEETSPQAIRLIWFGGVYKKPPAPGKSARQIAIDAAKKVRDTWTTQAIKTWATTWKKDEKYIIQPPVYFDRGAGTKHQLQNVAGMLEVGATGLATLIVALSDPKTRDKGIDQIKKPTMTLKSVKNTAKYPKKSYASLNATFVVKNTASKPVKEFPVIIRWQDTTKKRLLKTQLLWTNSAGAATGAITVTRQKAAFRLRVSITTPTANYRGEVAKAVRVNKKIEPPKKVKNR